MYAMMKSEMTASPMIFLEDRNATTRIVTPKPSSPPRDHVFIDPVEYYFSSVEELQWGRKDELSIPC